MKAHINSSLNGLDISFCPPLVTGNNKDLIDCLFLPVFPLASNLTQEWSSSWALPCNESGTLTCSPFHVSFPFTATQVNSKREEGRLIAVLEPIQERLPTCWGGWSTGWKRRRLRVDLFSVFNSSVAIEVWRRGQTLTGDAQKQDKSQEIQLQQGNSS